MPLMGYIPGLSARLDVAFWLQAALLVTAAASVQFAGWVEAPPLALLAFLGALAAALVAGSPERGPALHLRATAVGGLLTYAGGVYLTDASQWHERFGALHGSLAGWFSAALGGEATSDPLPLSVGIMALTWLTAYLTSWLRVRRGNIWATFLLAGAATVVNLTYLPESYTPYILVFLFVSLLALAHSTNLSRLAILQAGGALYSASAERLSLAHGLWLSVVIVAITAVLPIGDSPVSPLDWFYNPVHGAATDDLRGEVRRVFGAPRSGEPYSVRFLGSVLSLVRPVVGSTEPILFAEIDFAEVDIPLYWSAVAYDQYTSKVWKVQDTATMLLPTPAPDEGAVEADDPSTTATINYEVYMYVDAPYLMMAGDPTGVNPDVRIQAPASGTFRLDLADEERNEGLPDDLQRVASALAAPAGDPDLARMPGDLLVVKVIKEPGPSGGETAINVDSASPAYASDLQRAIDGPGSTVGLEVVRAPLESSPVLFTAIGPLGLGNSYRVSSEVMVVGEDTLRSASQDYPPGISDRFLQIPHSLPDRVSSLASGIVSGASNPYDKAVAIETYLRTLTYSGSPMSLPNDADAVDYFLFESRESYSDYFASAMAMMLRTQGVPTRLALGFGPGEEDADGFLVRDSDNHSWPEVYFPGVGWVPFEPTPVYDTRPRGVEFLEQSAQAVAEEAAESSSEEAGPRSSMVRFGTPLGTGGAMFGIFLLTGVALMRVLWARQYGPPRSVQTAYRRMRRLAALLGFPSPLAQTAFEFSRSLSKLIPEAGSDVELVASAYVRQRYGGVDPTSTEESRLALSWRRIKEAFMGRLKQTDGEPSNPPEHTGLTADAESDGKLGYGPR